MKRTSKPTADLREPWQIEQAKVCGCKGTDDMCPCQNENPWPGPAVDWRARATAAESQLAECRMDNERLDGCLGAAQSAYDLAMIQLAVRTTALQEARSAWLNSSEAYGSEIRSLEGKLAALTAMARSMLWDGGGRPDHMTACERTMGDTHPCTCGAEAFRKALGHDPGAARQKTVKP